MRSGRLLFLDDGNALGTKAVPVSLMAHVERVTCLDDFLDALGCRHHEIAIIRADWEQLFGISGETFRHELLSAAKRRGVMTAVLVQDMRAVDCERLIRDGFDDVLHEPKHLSQFEAQLRSFRRIATMRRELARRQTTLRQFLSIVEDSDLDLCFDNAEPYYDVNEAGIVLLDMDPAKSGATTLYKPLRDARDIQYFDDLEQAQAHIFLGNCNLTIINAVGAAEDALSLIAAMRASASFYNHPVLLIVQSELRPTSAQVFTAGANDYIEGEISAEMVLPRVQSLLRHEQLRHRLATQCERPAENIVHDNLTGFYSYGYAMVHLRQFEQVMADHQLPLTVAAISMDNIQRINDEFGFAAGDAVIRQVSRIIRHCVRGEDLVARVSGAKFLLLFPETELALARYAMVRINSILQYSTLTLPTTEHNVQATTSFAIAPWNVGDSLHPLLGIDSSKARQAA
jgi:diguanylate cyclase (GGDEF)-like protein